LAGVPLDGNLWWWWFKEVARQPEYDLVGPGRKILDHWKNDSATRSFGNFERPPSADILVALTVLAPDAFLAATNPRLHFRPQHACRAAKEFFVVELIRDVVIGIATIALLVSAVVLWVRVPKNVVR
jgi:hypothetical protein